LKQALLSLLLASFFPLALPAQTFVPEDVVVSDPTRSMYDMEFDSKYRFVWQNDQGGDAGTVYISYADPQTGIFLRPDGRSVTVGCCAVPIQDTGNGPEWGWSQQGIEAYWSAYQRGYSGQTTVVRAYQTLPASPTDQDYQNTPWQNMMYRNIADGNSPTPAKNFADPQTLLSYQDYPDRSVGGLWNFLWRNSFSSRSRLFPLGSGRRWVPNTHQIISARCTPSTANEVCVAGNDPRYMQIWTYDADTGLSTQLTFDTTFTKGPPFMWLAPEDGKYWFFAQTAPRGNSSTGGGDIQNGSVGYQQIKVYRQNTFGFWTVYKTLTLPSNLITRSPQPFTFGGSSYISVIGASNLDPNIGTFDAYFIRISDGLIRKVSGSDKIIRNDPETLVLQDASGNPSTIAYYYTQKVADTDSSGKTYYRGVIHKCATGITLTGVTP